MVFVAVTPPAMAAATNAHATSVATSAAPRRRRRVGSGVQSTPSQSNLEGRSSGRGGTGGSMPTIVRGVSATIGGDGSAGLRS
jgi:hypothetical protein